VLAPVAIRDHLVNTARTFIFDTGLAPAAAGAALTAADIIADDPTLSAAVRANARTVASICGIDRAVGAVQSLPMPSPDAAVSAALTLRQHGVLVGCFRPPSVPDGVSRLRITARADLSTSEVAEAAALVATVASPVPHRVLANGASARTPGPLPR
jgi:8-amino-7-oxononanoate synthase